MSNDTTRECATCQHCDTSEATRVSVRGSVVRHVVVGVCTHPLVFFHGKQVPDWMSGCPDHRLDPELASPAVLMAMERLLGVGQ
jgi:hypothetical protein